MIEENKENNQIQIYEQNDKNDNNNIDVKDNNINILSHLFKGYRDSTTKKFAKLKSFSFSNVISDNFRKDFYDLGEENDNIDYTVMINKKLDEIKNSSISQFQNYVDNINKKFDEFRNTINSFIESKQKKISNFKNPLNNKSIMIKYAKHNIFNKINNILQICDNIINNIEKNFELLNSFYENNILLDSKNQIEDFLINNSKIIENCSIVNKFNFAEIDINNIKEIRYYKYYINYLSQKKIENEEEIKHYKIIKEEMPNGLDFIKENFSLLDKLTLEGIVSKDLDNILETIGINTKKNKKLNLTTLNIKNFSSLSPNLDKGVPLNMLKKINIKYGAYIVIDKISPLFIEKNNNLKSLSLEDIHMTDLSFKALLLCLIGNESITNTLEYLSLEGNKITMVRYDNEHSQFQDRYFQNLKWFNLSRNNIYKFEFVLQALPKLKFIDLTSNNIPTSSFMEVAMKSKDKLVLFNDNMFITNSQKNNNIYINYLNETMPKFDTELKTLNLNFTYDIDNQTNLERLKLSNNVIYSLIKLDLSFCGLKTDVIINFFTNNPKFISLKQLILKYNNINYAFFESIMNIKEICLDNLNYLDLSENEIICNTPEKMESLCNFIVKNRYLEVIQFINSNFFSDLIDKVKDNFSKSGQFKEIINKLHKHTTENNRSFKFIVNEGNESVIKKIKEFNFFFEYKHF